MLALRPGRPRHFGGRAAALAGAPCLAGCTEAPAGAGPWIFITLATAALAIGAWQLGSWRARAASEAALRRSRSELEQWSRLRPDWQWETDAEHRLLNWTGPLQEPAAAADGVFAGGVAPPALAARLQQRQAFAGVRLRAGPAQPGGWELWGAPRLDEHGAFAGFLGCARPTDRGDALHAAAAAIDPLLASCATPALVALQEGGRWQVRHFNAAARALWPDLGDAAERAAALAALPAPVAAACESLAAGSTLEVEGWRLTALPGPTGDRHGLLLVQTAPTAGAAAAAPPAAPDRPASESEAFSFTVSHDLRAPIRVVEGFTRIVKEDYGRLLDRVGNDHLDRVLSAAARMNLMIDALLTLARLSSQPLARQAVNISQLAGWVVDDLRRGAPERIVEVTIEPGLAVQGDPTLLRQVLENLLGNAWKYSSRRDRARISLRRVVRDGRAVFEVRDNGAGFDMRSAERLFGLFQRLHSASDFPGHGVGLASVQRIVRRHGGEIWAEAEPGHGAAFYFTL
jgi:signal transduction histidine kinase